MTREFVVGVTVLVWELVGWYLPDVRTQGGVSSDVSLYTQLPTGGLLSSLPSHVRPSAIFSLSMRAVPTQPPTSQWIKTNYSSCGEDTTWQDGTKLTLFLNWNVQSWLKCWGGSLWCCVPVIRDESWLEPERNTSFPLEILAPVVRAVVLAVVQSSGN